MPAIDPYEPRSTHRLEGESLYPPQEVTDGFAHPEVRLEPCVSGQRVLKLRPTGGRPVRITLALPALPSSMKPTRRLVVGWADDGFPEAPQLWVNGSQQPFAWLEPASGTCPRTLAADLLAGPIGVPLSLTLVASAGSLDYVELDPG